MKKIIAQILTVVFVLGVLAGSINAMSFGVTLSSNKQTAKPGDEIVLTLGVADIDIEGGISSVEGTLDYDKNIFEPVEQSAVSPLNGWAPSYNDEDTELNGKFLTIKLGSVTKAEGVFTVKLKVKAGVKDQNTTVSVKDVTTTDGNSIISTAQKSVIIKIAENGGNQGGDNQGGDNQGGNNQGGNNQGGSNQGGNNQGGSNQGGNNQSGNNGTNSGNNTGYNGGKLPQTGTNGSIIIAVGILLAIGIGSLIKYRTMK